MERKKIQKLNTVLYATHTKMTDSKILTLFQKLSVYKCPGISRLFDNKFHQWEVIPLYLVPLY